MTDPAELTIHIDGAARGNPGPSAFAYVIEQGGEPIAELGQHLGTATNNQAEYTALVRALERAAELGARELEILSDSELIVKQMSGEYRVKNEDLRTLYEEAQALRRRFDVVRIRHVRRADNAHADRLCNEALDRVDQGTRPAGRSPTSVQSPSALDHGTVREEALVCLRAAACAWARGDANQPPAEAVWDQLWSILEENNALRTSGRKRRKH